jgi:hypothetical protein
MATSQVEVKAGKRGQAAQKSDYIARRNAYENFRGEGELESTGFGNMPKWADSPKEFWQAADEYERKNATAYREIVLALPREMTPSQRQALVEDFIQTQFSDKHAFEWGVHNPKASLEKGDQPHVHIIYSERLRDGNDRSPDTYFKRYNAKTPEKGGCQKYNPCSEISKSTPSAQQKIRDARAGDLLRLRRNAQDVSNKHLEAGGYIGRVDMRSLAAQGVDREPEQKLGARRIKEFPEMVEAVLASREAWQALQDVMEDELRRQGEVEMFNQMRASEAARHGAAETKRIAEELQREQMRRLQQQREKAEAVERKAAEKAAQNAIAAREAQEAMERQGEAEKIAQNDARAQQQAKFDVLLRQYEASNEKYLDSFEALAKTEQDLEDGLAEIGVKEADFHAGRSTIQSYFGTDRAELKAEYALKGDAARAEMRRSAVKFVALHDELAQLGHSFELPKQGLLSRFKGKSAEAQREENYGFALNHAADPDLAKAVERHERNEQQARYKAAAEQQYRADEPLRKAQEAKDWEAAQLKNEQGRAAKVAERDKPTEPKPSRERDNDTFEP